MTVFANSQTTNELVNEAANDSARVSGQDREIPPSRNQSVCRIWRIPPARKLGKNKEGYFWDFIYGPLCTTVHFTLHKRSQELKQSQGSLLGVWERGYESHKLAKLAGICCHRLPLTTDRLSIVLCCLSLLRLIEMAKKNQQYVGPLKWESGAKVTRCCLILFFELDKDLESQIGVAS